MDPKNQAHILPEAHDRVTNMNDPKAYHINLLSAVEKEYRLHFPKASNLAHNSFPHGLSLSTNSLPRLNSSAAAAPQDERQQTLKAATRRYPKAIA